MISQIKNNIPLFSGLLIFIGYLNYHFYYTQFDIPINSYLTPSELIFSFLPLTIPFLLTISFLIIWQLGLHLVIVRQEKEKSPYDSSSNINEIVSIPIAWKELKFRLKKKKDWLDWILMPITISIFLLSIAAQIFLIGYVYLIIDGFVSKDPYMGFGGTMILGIIWLLLIFARLDIYKKEETKQSVRRMGYILTVTVATILLWINNKEKAQKVLNGKGEYEVILVFEKDSIKTDTSLVFIGKTSEYVFFRDRQNEQNKIFKLDKLQTIDLKPTKANNR